MSKKLIYLPLLYMVISSNNLETLMKIKYENFSIKSPLSKEGKLVINFDELIKRSKEEIELLPKAEQSKVKKDIDKWA